MFCLSGISISKGNGMPRVLKAHLMNAVSMFGENSAGEIKANEILYEKVCHHLFIILRSLSAQIEPSCVGDHSNAR